jgi:hypothetical protein
MKMVDKNVATVPDIDLSMQLGAGHPMGPLHLADYVGLDTCFNALEGWVKDYPGDTDFFVPEVREVAKIVDFSRLMSLYFYLSYHASLSCKWNLSLMRCVASTGLEREGGPRRVRQKVRQGLLPLGRR